MEILILFIIIFLLVPLLKTFFAVFRVANTARKEYQRQTEQFRKAQGGNNQNQQQSWNKQQKQPKGKGSIRDKMRAYYKNAGEYVDFEEIKDTDPKKQV